MPTLQPWRTPSSTLLTAAGSTTRPVRNQSSSLASSSTALPTALAPCISRRLPHCWNQAGSSLESQPGSRICCSLSRSGPAALPYTVMVPSSLRALVSRSPAYTLRRSSAIQGAPCSPAQAAGYSRMSHQRTPGMPYERHCRLEQSSQSQVRLWQCPPRLCSPQEGHSISSAALRAVPSRGLRRGSAIYSSSSSAPTGTGSPASPISLARNGTIAQRHSGWVGGSPLGNESPSGIGPAASLAAQNSQTRWSSAVMTALPATWLARQVSIAATVIAQTETPR